MTPTDLVSAIVSNNPTAVQQNLMNMGVVDQQFALTPQSFAELLSSLPHEIIPDRQHANNFVANALNIPINNNGISAGDLQTMMNQYRLPMKDLVYKIFDENMPVPGTSQAVEKSTTCGCGGTCSQGMNSLRYTILALAFLGVLFIITLIVKLILKTISK